MKNKQITTKCAECDARKLVGLLFCAKHLKAEYKRYLSDDHVHGFKFLDCARPMICACGEEKEVVL